MTARPNPCGAYGLKIQGLSVGALLPRVDSGAPELSVSVELGCVGGRRESFGPRGAEIALLDGGWVSLTPGGHAHFVLPRSVPDEEIVHPWLVPAAATLNGWHGRQVLHGGAFARDGRGVVVLGDKEDGKSTLLAALALAGEVDILADDLAVIDNGAIQAGPRCIDLRPGTEAGLAHSRAHQLVRDAGRLRMPLKPCPPAAVLRAIVVLGWCDGNAVTLRPLEQSAGFTALLPHAMSAGWNGNLLDLLGVPVWSLSRPRSWTIMPEVVERVAALADPPGLDPRTTARNSPDRGTSTRTAIPF